MAIDFNFGGDQQSSLSVPGIPAAPSAARSSALSSVISSIMEARAAKAEMSRQEEAQKQVETLLKKNPPEMRRTRLLEHGPFRGLDVSMGDKALREQIIRTRMSEGRTQESAEAEADGNLEWQHIPMHDPLVLSNARLLLVKGGYKSTDAQDFLEHMTGGGYVGDRDLADSFEDDAYKLYRGFDEPPKAAETHIYNRMGSESLPPGPPKRLVMAGRSWEDLGFNVGDDEYNLRDPSAMRGAAWDIVADRDHLGGVRLKVDLPAGTPDSIVRAFQHKAKEANDNPQHFMKLLGQLISQSEGVTTSEALKRGQAWVHNRGIYLPELGLDPAPEQVGPQPLKAPVELTPADEEILKSMMKFPKWNLGEEEERKKREEEKSDLEAFREFVKEEGDG